MSSLFSIIIRTSYKPKLQLPPAPNPLSNFPSHGSHSRQIRVVMVKFAFWFIFNGPFSNFISSSFFYNIIKLINLIIIYLSLNPNPYSHYHTPLPAPSLTIYRSFPSSLPNFPPIPLFPFLPPTYIYVDPTFRIFVAFFSLFFVFLLLRLFCLNFIFRKKR